MESFTQVLQYAVASLFTVISFLLWATAYYGRTCAWDSVDPYGSCLDWHKRLAKCTFWATIAAIVLVELYVQLKHRGAGGWWFVVHLCFAAPFGFYLWNAVHRNTGEKNPQKHRKIVYRVLWCYGGTYVTGLALLFPEQRENLLALLGVLTVLLIKFFEALYDMAANLF